MAERRCLWLRIFDHRLEASGGVTASREMGMFKVPVTYRPSRGEAVMGRARSGGWWRASSTRPVMLEFFLLTL